MNALHWTAVVICLMGLGALYSAEMFEGLAQFVYTVAGIVLLGLSILLAEVGRDV